MSNITHRPANTEPSKEQLAVIAAIEERMDMTIDPVIVHPDPIIELMADGKVIQIAYDGTTRGNGFVPTRLYGQLPSSEEKRRTWGTGLPKHARKHLS